MSRLTLATISSTRRRELNLREAETSHLLEWLAVDMVSLLRVVRSEL